MISNSAYLTGPHHRGMRSYIKEHFNRFRALDLHGGIKRGSAGDKNVFDIKTGVAVGLWERLAWRGEFACSVAGLSGSRESKLAAMDAATLASDCRIFFVPQPDKYLFEIATEKAAEYRDWVSVEDVFPLTSVGIKTNRDHLTIGFSDEEIDAGIQTLIDLA